MCLFSSRKPRWEEDIVFSSRRAYPKRHSHHHSSSSRTQMTETIIKTHRPSAEYVHAPPPLALPEPKPITPPPPPPAPPSIAPHAPSPPPRPVSRIELVSVEEDLTPVSPRTSRSHVSSSHRSHSRRGSSSHHRSASHGRDEVYIERERIRERIAPPPSPPRVEHETFRYVEGPRPRSVVYENRPPRVSNRVVERERQRVVIGDEGRRRSSREYY